MKNPRLTGDFFCVAVMPVMQLCIMRVGLLFCGCKMVVPWVRFALLTRVCKQNWGACLSAYAEHPAHIGWRHNAGATRL
jgi:hypothetical protein